MSYQSSQANKNWGGVGGGGGYYNYTSNNGGATIGNWNTGGNTSIGTGNQNGVWGADGSLISQPNFASSYSNMNPYFLNMYMTSDFDPNAIFKQGSPTSPIPQSVESMLYGYPPSFGSLSPGSVESGPIQPALGPQGLPQNQIPPPPGTAQAVIAARRAGVLSNPPGYAGHANHPSWAPPRPQIQNRPAPPGTGPTTGNWTINNMQNPPPNPGTSYPQSSPGYYGPGLF